MPNQDPDESKCFICSLMFEILYNCRWMLVANLSLTNLCLSIDLSVSLSILGAEKHDSMFTKTISRTIMEVKERRPYSSLSKSRRHKEGPLTGEMLFLGGHIKSAASRFRLMSTELTETRTVVGPLSDLCPVYTYICFFLHQVYRGTVKTHRVSASQLRSPTPPVKHSRPSTSTRTRPGWNWEYGCGE